MSVGASFLFFPFIIFPSSVIFEFYGLLLLHFYENNSVKRGYFFLLYLSLVGSLYAQHSMVNPPDNKNMSAYVERGDTVPHVALRPVYVYPRERFTSKKQERYYWRTVRDVKFCLPLSKIVSSTLIETTEYIYTLPNEKAREKHLRQMERDLIKEYEPLLRKMTYRQGKILLKLIVRECDSSPYDIIKGYLGSFAADFWQGVAKLFTADLKVDYQPKDEDLMIERIATLIEQGQL